MLYIYIKKIYNWAFDILDQLNQLYIPIIDNYLLNERHYAAIQGYNKEETAKKNGEEVIRKWRRLYEISPTQLNENNERNPANIEQIYWYKRITFYWKFKRYYS